MKKNAGLLCSLVLLIGSIIPIKLASAHSVSKTGSEKQWWVYLGYHAPTKT